MARKKQPLTHDNLIDVFPYNLAYSLGQGDMEFVYKTYIPGLLEVLADRSALGLTEREATFIYYYFRDGLTYASIGQIVGRSSECVRRVIAKSMRKLLHPRRRNRYRLVTYGEHNDALAKTVELYDALAKTLEVESSEDDDDVPLIDLNLSVRPFNALRRAGYKNLSDFVGVEVNALTKIKNLGRISFNETMDVLERHGIVEVDGVLVEKTQEDQNG